MTVKFVAVPGETLKGWGISEMFIDGKSVGFVVWGPNGPIDGTFPTLEAAKSQLRREIRKTMFSQPQQKPQQQPQQKPQPPSADEDEGGGGSAPGHP